MCVRNVVRNGCSILCSIISCPTHQYSFYLNTECASSMQQILFRKCMTSMSTEAGVVWYSVYPRGWNWRVCKLDNNITCSRRIQNMNLESVIAMCIILETFVIIRILNSLQPNTVCCNAFLLDSQKSCSLS